MSEQLTMACGCTVEVDHDRGERRVFCDGSSPTCAGQVAYVATARPVTAVVYEVRPFVATAPEPAATQ